MSSSFLRFSRQVNFDNVPRGVKWIAGFAIATPVFAVVQGSLLLMDYREHHLDAPVPVMPARGIVVMDSESTTQDFSERPLKLLVLGDSLAVGVGVSKKGTPILPESIARYLSHAFGGRPVSWTCVGTTGASAAQIVIDIKRYQEKPDLLETTLAEWQTTRRRAEKWVKQRQSEAHIQAIKQNDGDQSKNKLQRWWNRVKDDFDDFRREVLDDHEEKQQEINQILLERRLQKQTTKLAEGIDAREFDIAVVLTGLNDLKSLFLPFLMRGENTNTDPQEKSTLKDGFLRIIDALQDRMKLDISTPDEKDQSASQSSVVETVSNKQRGPLVVFPALPATPIPVFHRAPLSWFIVPLINMMDQNKKLLAEKFPNMVLFVESPSIETLRQIEDGRGPLFAERQAEKVLLSISDVTQRAREKAETLMKQHYQRLTDDRQTSKQDKEEPRDVYENACHDHLESQHGKLVGSSLISADNVHPNDEGYDFWGRHIAQRIVEDWVENERFSMTRKEA